MIAQLQKLFERIPINVATWPPSPDNNILGYGGNLILKIIFKRL